MSASPAISVTGLHKTYKKTQALRGLGFEVPSGKVTGFLGPNGSGKTTTFRALLGLTRPDSGEMQILGLPSPGGLPEITKRVGVIIEEPGLIKALSGTINLQVAADTLGFGHDRIADTVEFVGLTDDADRRVEEYSKGMRQRLALAAAMLGDPELLILDEPLDGLDPAGQHAFKARLRALADGGRTVMVSSHDLSDIEALADYVIVIDRGRLVTQGSLTSLLDGGGTRVAVEPSAAGERALVAAGLGVTRADGALVVATDDGALVTRILAGAGLYPSEVRPQRSSLESVFLGMTGEMGDS
jgi:ABC-type multidrug transport system ATPase subunit